MNKLLTLAGAVACMVVSSFAAPVVTYDSDVGLTYENGHWFGNFVVGDAAVFDIKSISFDAIGGNNVITINSNYFSNLPETEYKTVMGDLLIDSDANGAWDKAIVFDNHTGSTTSGSVALYSGVTNFKTAADFAQSNWNTYRPLLQVAADVTDLTADKFGTWAISGNDNTITIGSIGLSEGARFGWAMTCGNDFIRATVPEPGMISIIGMSLLSLAGVAAYRRKK